MKKKTKSKTKKVTKTKSKTKKVTVYIPEDKMREAEEHFSRGMSIPAVAKRVGITVKEATVLYQNLQR